MNPNNLLDIADPDTPIYRIYSKARFLDLLTTRANGLVNPEKWDDPFENFFLQAAIEGPGGERISMQQLAADWYGQCWTLNEDTDAMWRIYSNAKDGVKVRTTVAKLFNAFYDNADRYASLKFFCGRVVYQTEAEIIDFMAKVHFQDIAFGGQAGKFAQLLCVKRKAFEHENEIRLLFQDTDPKRGVNGVATFDFDVNVLCTDVVLDPRLADGERGAFEAEVRNAGCTLAISQSPLYHVPRFKIPL